MNLSHWRAESDIGQTAAEALVVALERNSTLKTLLLDCNCMGDSIVQILAQALRKNSSLQKISLCYNNFGDKGCSAIVRVLHENTTLVRVELGGNKLTSCSGNALGEMLRQNRTLKELELGQNVIGVGGPGLRSIIGALGCNCTLSSLDLSENFSGEIARDIAVALHSNTSLKAIYLCANGIGDTEVGFFAQMLACNTTLRCLDLSRNNIGDAGAQTVAESLKKNATLLTLYLSANQIGDKGATELFGALEINSTLLSLDVHWNVVSDLGAQALATVLQKNQRLQVISLSWEHIASETVKRGVAESLQQNVTMLDMGRDPPETIALYLARNDCLSGIGDERYLFERTKTVAVALKSFCLPIYVLLDIVETECALEMARAESKCIQARCITLERHLQWLAARGRSKRAEAVNYVQHFVSR